LSKVGDGIEKIVFIAIIFKGEERKQNFGQIMNAYIRVVDQGDNKELIRYDLSEDYSIETSVEIAELYKKNGVWKFKAVGGGTKKTLETIVSEYGIK